MTHNNNIWGENLNTLLEALGMKKEDIECMIKNDSLPEQTYFSNGPLWDPNGPYWASYYGTISIKDF